MFMCSRYTMNVNAERKDSQFLTVSTLLSLGKFLEYFCYPQPQIKLNILILRTKFILVLSDCGPIF
jgi:hypothetical protein